MNSTTSMWPDDPESTGTTSFRDGTGDNSGDASGIGHAHEPWTYNSTAPQNGSSRSSDMEVEEDPATAQQPMQPAELPLYLMSDYMIQDDERLEEFEDSLDGMSDGGANLDILAVTDVLTMGMDIVDEFTADIPAFAPPSAPPLHETLTSPFETALAPSAPPNMPPYVPQQTTPFNHQFAVHMLAHNNLNPNAASNPNATALSPENYDLPDFLRLWAWQNGGWQAAVRERGRWPWSNRIGPQMSQQISQVDYMNLEGDKYDVQGIDWEDLGVTRAEARERRFLTYKNYVNIPESDRWQVS